MIKTIGIIPVLDRRDGGIFQYSQAFLTALAPLVSDKLVEKVVVFCHPEFRGNLPLGPWHIAALAPPSPWQHCKRWLKSVLPATIKDLTAQSPHISAVEQHTHIKLNLRRWFLKHNVDFMIYPSPMAASFEAGIPFMMTIHDLQHRFQPHLPEFQNRVFEEREFVFKNGALQATRLLVDSQIGAEDALTCYQNDGLDPQQIDILPFIPAPYLKTASLETMKSVQHKYQLPLRYLFYPAQFWPHKQHHLLIDALTILKTQYGIKATLVVCGSHSGKTREEYYHQVIDKARKAGIIDQILNLGYVPDEDMAALYQSAIALVMPTLFGPTNIPVLEAWKLNCLVVTSDLRGIREQVGDAGILVNPYDAYAWASVVAKIWENSDQYLAIKQAGQKRLEQYTEDDFRTKVRVILEEIIAEERGIYAEDSASA